MQTSAEPNTVLNWLLREFPSAKRTTFKEMLKDRRVLINDIPAIKLSQPVRPSDKLRVRPRGSLRQGPLPTLHPLRLIHEDDDLLVVDKPAGLLTSTVAKEKRPTALAIVRRYIAARDPKAPVGLIHRLDRDASGLIVFSKSHRAYKSLKAQFFRHSVDRVYEAVVEGVPNPKNGRIESHLLERADGTVHSLPKEVHGKGQRAITDYETIQTFKPASPLPPGGAKRSGMPRSAAPRRAPHSTNKQSLLKVTLLTGRKHQIRAHLAARGNPIVGDSVYGSAQIPDLHLRAIELIIDHPATGRRTPFSLPPGLANHNATN